MRLYLDAQEDGDLYPDDGYDQSTPLYNLLMDAKETAVSLQFAQLPVVLLHPGVYHFYAGYAEHANGSGIPRLISVTNSDYTALEGKDAILRLHGKMQWLSFRLCRRFTLSQLQIEAVDDRLFAPHANLHRPQLFSVTEPGKADDATILFEHCQQICLEHLVLDAVTVVFLDCAGIELRQISGSGKILLLDCSGDLQYSDLDCLVERQDADEVQILCPGKGHL